MRKVLVKKILACVVYFIVFFIAMMVCANFIPNPLYMLPFGLIVIVIIAYFRRVRRNDTEKIYLDETDSDDLASDIKYLFRFVEYRCELIAAAITLVVGLLAAGKWTETENLGGMIADAAIFYIVFMVAYSVADAALWVFVFKKYHPDRIRRVR